MNFTPSIIPNPRITHLAAELRLAYIKQHWHELTSDDSLTHEEYLLELLETGHENRLNNGITRRIKAAKFPYKKYLVDFDKSKCAKEFLSEFEELETLDFINKNVILIGTPGAGKTHYKLYLGIARFYAARFF